MTVPVRAGCEPFSAAGGPVGVLVLHGFTGSPHSMRPLARALAAAGFTVEAPLLPGHGTVVEDLLPRRWGDWYTAARSMAADLAARCDRLVVVGLSMGGTLAATLAAEGGPAGLVAINPMVVPPADSFLELSRNVIASGIDSFPGIGNDVAKPGADELGYSATPVAGALSLFEANAALTARLTAITCPALVFTSRVDHVVPQESSEALVAGVAGPVQHVWLERSYHVATLDYDADLIEATTVDFVTRVAGATEARSRTPTRVSSRCAARFGRVAAAEAVLAERDPVLARLIDQVGPCTIGEHGPDGRHGGFDHFGALCRSICYQQLAGKAASTIHGRFLDLFDGALTPVALLGLPEGALRGAGLSGNKAASVTDLASRIDAGLVDLEHAVTLDDEELIDQLTAVRGIGRWTAEMFLMFQLGRLDVWPVGDLGVRKGFGLAWGLADMPTPKRLLPLGDPFRPYRSVCAWYCWRAADTILPGSL